MFRRYNRWHSRFDQPDPYDGSYSLTNPQSFNRYAYVQGDPVNFTDPSGLAMSLTQGVAGDAVVGRRTPHLPKQGGPCDQTIRDIFADDDAQAAASGFEPTGFPATDAWRNGQNRSQAGGPNPNQWGHLNGYSGHIYGSSPGTSDTTLYVPGNFSSYTPPSGNDAVATFFYRQLGNQQNVTLAVFHVGNFGIQRNNTNDAGSVRMAPPADLAETLLVIGTRT
jgi:hypothetical protein